MGNFFALAILSLSYFSPQLWQNWTIQKYRFIWSIKKVNDIPGWQPGLVPEGWCAVRKGRCFPALPGGHCRGAKAAFIFHWGSPGAQWMGTAERTCRSLHRFIHLIQHLIRSSLQKDAKSELYFTGCSLLTLELCLKWWILGGDSAHFTSPAWKISSLKQSPYEISERKIPLEGSEAFCSWCCWSPPESH